MSFLKTITSSDPYEIGVMLVAYNESKKLNLSNKEIEEVFNLFLNN